MVAMITIELGMRTDGLLSSSRADQQIVKTSARHRIPVSSDELYPSLPTKWIGRNVFVHLSYVTCAADSTSATSSREASMIYDHARVAQTRGCSEYEDAG